MVVRGLFKDLPASSRLGDAAYWADIFPQGVARGMLPYGHLTWEERCGDESNFGGRIPFADMAQASVDGIGFKSTMWVPRGENSSQVVEDLDWYNKLGTDELPLAIPEPGGMFFTQAAADTEETLSTDWHHAFGSNLAIHVAGSKRWLMMPPALSHVMQPTWWEFSQRGYPTERMLGKVPPMEVVAHAGDMLFVPVWWWHQVHHHGPKQFTVLATTRMLQAKQAFTSHPWSLPLIIRDSIVNMRNVNPQELRPGDKRSEPDPQ